MAASACAAPRVMPSAVSLALPLPSPPPSVTPALPAIARMTEQGSVDFTSERGLVHLAPSSTNVLTGTYGGGVLTCIESPARDAVVSCRWYEGMSEGRAVFHRDADGALTGTWGNGASTTDGGAWTLVPVPRGGIAGVWDTNWGVAIVTDTALGMHVDYPGGTLECTARSARRYECTWAEGSLAGAAELAIESQRVLRGRWGTGASATDGGGWLFVKR